MFNDVPKTDTPPNDVCLISLDIKTRSALHVLRRSGCFGLTPRPGRYYFIGLLLVLVLVYY